MPTFNLDDYVSVNERVGQFRKDHPDWSLIVNLRFDGDAILGRAEIADESGRIIAVGHAEEIRDQGMVNKTSAVENCETSAWGRALANLGYEVQRSIASREEMQKVSQGRGRSQPRRTGSASKTENDPGPGNVSQFPTPSDEDVARHPSASRRRSEPILPKDQALAKQAADLGIDDTTRSDVIFAITKGRTRSGKDLEPHEVIWVATAYEELSSGIVELRYDPDGTPRIGKPRPLVGNNPGPPGDEPF